VLSAEAVYNLISRPSLRGSRCENDGGALVQRDDDTEGVILHRLEDLAERYSVPLIEYYNGPRYHRVAADRNQDTISEELLSMLVELAPAFSLHDRASAATSSQAQRKLTLNQRC